MLLYIIAVLFVLFLLVMCICMIYKCLIFGYFGTAARSGQASRRKPSQATLWEALGSVPSHVTA
jgi:hypothetical protein